MLRMKWIRFLMLFTLNIYGLQGSLVTSLAHGLSSSGLFCYRDLQNGSNLVLLWLLLS